MYLYILYYVHIYKYKIRRRLTVKLCVRICPLVPVYYIVYNIVGRTILRRDSFRSYTLHYHKYYYIISACIQEGGGARPEFYEQSVRFFYDLAVHFVFPHLWVVPYSYMGTFCNLKCRISGKNKNNTQTLRRDSHYNVIHSPAIYCVMYTLLLLLLLNIQKGTHYIMHTTPINNGCYYIVILSVTKRYDL